jgi:DNA-directed RNA polymerase subunit RPC12/RpoP
MAKTIKILRCTLCTSTDIDTNSKTYFKCKNCGLKWKVIKEEFDEQPLELENKKEGNSE